MKRQSVYNERWRQKRLREGGCTWCRKPGREDANLCAECSAKAIVHAQRRHSRVRPPVPKPRTEHE